MPARLRPTGRLFTLNAWIGLAAITALVGAAVGAFLLVRAPLP